ncbi:MAG TPA: acyltransferase family protein [Rhodocyclaceae bacterium]|nr:acyltransferase family protein [Rhodocyclaceae bacterium]
MTRASSCTHFPAVDAVKAVASNLIVWHHLVFYGTMSEAVRPVAPGLMDWLSDQARIFVQAFLVVGGFLAARSLTPKFLGRTGASLLPVLWSRYARLMQTYLVALAVAIACAAIARHLSADPSIPAAPSLIQVLAHLFLLQDIIGQEALSAGVWYVAIDFQLYALLALILWAARSDAAAIDQNAGRLATGACIVLTVAALAWLNRDSSLDSWAIYFFGAYGLGVLAQRLTADGRGGTATIVVTAMTAGALLIEWRSRVLVAGVTALLLVWCSVGRISPRWAGSRLTAFFGRISYTLFLIHYPVCLLVGNLVHGFWPDSTAMNAVGLASAWLLSIAAADALHRLTEVSDAPIRLVPARNAGA